jgi:NAD(P)-dependent dehydrogenase (short-subunit alcohol dehydrogenase family)
VGQEAKRQSTNQNTLMNQPTPSAKLRLENQVAVVTGGARGIGAGIVERFLEEGARVVFSDLMNEKGKGLEAELGKNVAFYRADATSPSDTEALMNFTVGHFGRLDCVVNNAGAGGEAGPISEVSFQGFQQSVNLLLLGTFLGIKYCVPHMERGSIINIASIAGLTGGHAMDGLRHRGPDTRGAWLSPNRRVALGHTRLSIIDLETGDQPITNENGRIHIIANGEFYDFERQRSELTGQGHVFRTRSDSEIALHLFEEFGTHCVQKLRGEFAFVLWDDGNQMLFAARDRLGIKPLYNAVYDDTIYLASEIKALFAAGVPARWDHECFYQLSTAPQMSDRTLFDGVYQVPPGYCLTATMNECALRVTGISTTRELTSWLQVRDRKVPISKSLAVFLRKRYGCECALMCR